MKKTLLLAIFALSINAFAQSKHPVSNSMKQVHGTMDRTGIKISDPHSEMNLGRTSKFTTNNPQDLIQIFDSIYEWEINLIHLDWYFYEKYSNIIYDSKNNLTNILLQEWNVGNWVNFRQFEYTYNTNNIIASELIQEWYNSSWENYDYTTYTYDASYNLINELNKYWNDNTWINNSLCTYIYDANNNKTSELHQYWDSSTWINNSLYTYIYDANNNKTSELLQYWDNSTWINYYQFTYTYDANNNLTSELRQNWNSSTWENFFLNTFTYDASNNLSNALEQSWTGNDWRNHLLYTYTYDANNNLIIALGQIWTSFWRQSSLCTNTYDANNFITSKVGRYWSDYSTSLMSGDSIYYYYHTILGLNYPIAQEGNILVYPNPTSTNITIETPIKGSISILSLNGQQLLRQEITEPSTTIDVSGLKSGVFVVKVIGDKGVQVGKFIKH